GARTDQLRRAAVRVLLIEDDLVTVGFLTERLMEAGCHVVHASDGATGRRLAVAGGFDVAIVDRMLPGLDGISLVQSLRRTGWRTPILFLTTMSGIEDRVDGLEAGGDDYLVKPFAFAELHARLRALTRRPTSASAETQLRVADLRMDVVTRRVWRGDHAIELQPREFQLLEFLMRNVGNVVTRRQLLEGVWEFHFDPQTNIVETHISRLRTKVERECGQKLIVTVRGVGYLIRDPAA
ncbi:response regulator transcription factor, partial [Methylobacterium oryzisoli]